MDQKTEKDFLKKILKSWKSKKVEEELKEKIVNTKEMERLIFLWQLNQKEKEELSR